MPFLPMLAIAFETATKWLRESGHEYRDRQLLLILAFGLANGLLYCCLLPLWDGFDEPFHYGYVTSISVDHRLPTLQSTTTSEEVEQSLRLAPLPPVLSRTAPGATSLDEWLALPVGERLRRRIVLAGLPPSLRHAGSGGLNYEAQQAPLAYVLLTPLDWLLAGVPLATRILFMRLMICVTSTLLLAVASVALFQAMGLRREFRNLALFLLFATQMTWAAVAHIGNDWLAIPVSVAFLAALAMFVQRGKSGPAIWLAVFLSAGLLTKAYCLAFVPVFLAVVFRESIRKTLRPATALLAASLPLVIAGPWYLRNLMLYGSVSATQESVAGVGIFRTLEAAPHINWLASAVRLARSSLWTGNWSFIAFPRWPLNVELVLAAVALVMLLARPRNLADAQRWVLGTCLVFLLAMAYQQAAMWAFSNGSSAQAEPWYLQSIVPGILALVALGLQYGAQAGRLLARLLALTAAGVSAASYLTVLFPWYGGFRGRGVLELLHWWPETDSQISTVALVPAAPLYGLLILFLASLSVAVTVALQVGKGNAQSQNIG